MLCFVRVRSHLLCYAVPLGGVRYSQALCSYQELRGTGKTRSGPRSILSSGMPPSLELQSPSDLSESLISRRRVRVVRLSVTVAATKSKPSFRSKPAASSQSPHSVQS
eukprot:2726004-Rhodomonas_salina.4